MKLSRKTAREVESTRTRAREKKRPGPHQRTEICRPSVFHVLTIRIQKKNAALKTLDKEPPAFHVLTIRIQKNAALKTLDKEHARM